MQFFKMLNSILLKCIWCGAQEPEDLNSVQITKQIIQYVCKMLSVGCVHEAMH